MKKHWLWIAISPLLLLWFANVVGAVQVIQPSSEAPVLALVVEMDSDGTWRDIVFLPAPVKSKVESNQTSVHKFIIKNKDRLGVNPDDLALTREIQSGGNYVAWFQQYWNGERVFDADLQLVARNGQVICLRNRTCSVRIQDSGRELTAADVLSDILDKDGVPFSAPERGIYQDRWVYRIQAIFPTDACELTLDASSMNVLKRRSLHHFDRTGSGLVFHPNPISSSGDPSLKDGEDFATEFLNGERFAVDLGIIDESGVLKNQYVDLTAEGINLNLIGVGRITDYEPGSARWEDVDGFFDFDRDDFRFEEVNTFYWITNASAYIAEVLEHPEAVNYMIPVHAHYMFQDNSFYSEIDKGLHFGDGGVDDAEDAEIILHEFGHAVIHNLLPGFGSTWESAALEEGTCDYIAASISNDGNFPDTIGEWDASSYDLINSDPPRLRPIVTDRLYPDDMGDPYPMTGQPDIHWDGVLWSSTLWEIKKHIGKQPMDAILFESLPMFPSDSSFDSAALRVLQTSGFLYDSLYESTVSYFFTKRGILGQEYVLNPEVHFDDEMVVFPYIVEDEVTTTNIAILNPHAFDQTAKVHVVGDNGNEIYPVEVINIPSRGRNYISPLRAKISSKCWMVVTSEEKLLGYACIRNRDETKGMFLTGTNGLSDELIIPHIATKNEVWKTETVVSKVSDVPGLSILESNGQDNVTLDDLELPFTQIGLTWFDSVYAEVSPESFAGWAKIKDILTCLAGVEVFEKRADTVFQSAGLTLDSASDSVLYVPHVAKRDNYWWTGIVVVNPGTEKAQFTVEAYADNGVRISEIDLELEAGHKLVSLIQNIWSDSGLAYPTETAWVKIVSPEVALTGSFLFGTLEEKGDRLLAGISLARNPSTQLLFGQVTTDPDHWTGISFINTGTTGAQITVQALDDGGTVLAEEIWLELLLPGQKHVSLAGDLLSAGLPDGTTQVRVHSDQPLVGFELWGNLVPRQDYICGMLAFSATEAP